MSLKAVKYVGSCQQSLMVIELVMAPPDFFFAQPLDIGVHAESSRCNANSFFIFYFFCIPGLC